MVSEFDGCVFDLCIGEIDCHELGVLEVRTLQVGAGEVRVDYGRLMENCSGQVVAGEIGSLDGRLGGISAVIGRRRTGRRWRSRLGAGDSRSLMPVS